MQPVGLKQNPLSLRVAASQMSVVRECRTKKCVYCPKADLIITRSNFEFLEEVVRHTDDLQKGQLLFCGFEEVRWTRWDVLPGPKGIYRLTLLRLRNGKPSEFIDATLIADAKLNVHKISGI